MGCSPSRRQRKEVSADPGGTQHWISRKKEGILSSETEFEDLEWLIEGPRRLAVSVSERPRKVSKRLRKGISARSFKESLPAATPGPRALSPEFEQRIKVLQDIQSLGPRATLAYQSALEAGRVQVYRAQVMLIGQDRAGKTSLKKSLLGLPFDPVELSTDGVEVDPAALEIEVEQVQNWQRIHEKPGMALFGNGLVNIMAKELDGEIRTTVGYVPGKPNEKTSEQDKVPVEEAGHCDSNDAVLEPALPKLKINPDLPPEEFIDPLVERLKDGDLPTESSSKEHHITLDIWDFAGQYLYYACYPAFLSQRAVYLLIYNLSKGLKDTAQPCVRQSARDTLLTNPNQETNLENFLSWLASISTMCSTKSDMDEKKEKDLPYSRPPIFIVGTHADKPVQNIIKVESEIQEEISGKEYAGHVIRPFFAVDNTKGCSDDGVGALKEQLVQVLKQEPYMGEELPLRWFNFERLVQALLAEKVYYLELGRLQAIIQNICKIDNEEEIALMLDFYHKRREIVKHNETVVLQARWLINVFKQLITIRSFNDMDPIHSKLWKQMEDTGILSTKLVDHVFSKFCHGGIIKKDILDMMEMFGLIAKFETSTTEPTYFVPAQLKSPPGRLREMELSPSEPCALYIHFLTGFVPFGLFNQLLSLCTKWCSKNEFVNKPYFFDGAARFFIGKKFVYQLIIIRRKRYLKVLLKQTKRVCEAPLSETEKLASFVRCFLEDAFNELLNKLPWLKTLKYEMCVACPYCPEEKATCRNHGQVCCTHEDCLCLIQVLPGGQLPFCEKCFSDDSMTVPGLEKWFSTATDRRDGEPSRDNAVSRTAPSCENQSTDSALSSTPLCSLAHGQHIWPPPGKTQKESLLAGASRSDSQQSLKVALLASEWKSSKGGLSTINRKLAIVLANQVRVKVTFLVPECIKDDKDDADSQNVKIVEVQRRPGYDPLDWLISPPGDLEIDVVLGHGATLGKQAQFIREKHRCKWVQLVHTEPEALAMHKQYERAIARGEEKSTNEVDLCKLSDLVVAVGPKMKNSIEAKLRSCEKHQDIFQLTPGIFVEFSDVCQAARESNVFRVLTFGRGDSEDFSVKGYDIAPKAIKVLNDSSYRLIFVGAPDGGEEVVASKLLSTGVSKNQLVVRKFVHSIDGLKDCLHEADLAIMPSRTEAFGLAALEAMSAGLPFLVSANSGFADVLRSLPFGDSHVVKSEEPEEWAKAISAVRTKDRAKRLEEIQTLRKDYEDKYSWQKQCESLVKRMWCMVYADRPDSEPSDNAVSRTALSSENNSIASSSSSTPQCPLAHGQNNWPPPGKTQGENSVLESPRLRNNGKSVNVLQNLQVSKHDVNTATSTTDLREKLNKIASDKGFIVCDNEGSGNCLFHALSEQLDLVRGIKISHEDLRLQLVQYLRENPTLSDGTELFNFVDGYSSWPDYLKKMANRGTWGDHVVLHAAANRFKTSIQVISSLSHNHNQTITPECHSDSIDRLVLGHVHELHYVSLRPRQV